MEIVAHDASIILKPKDGYKARRVLKVGWQRVVTMIAFIAGGVALAYMKQETLAALLLGAVAGMAVPTKMSNDNNTDRWGRRNGTGD